jgi:hypothetical protein
MIAPILLPGDFSPDHCGLHRIFANPTESQRAEITSLFFGQALRACESFSDDLHCVAMVRVIRLSQRFGAAAMIGDELFPHLPVQMNSRAVETGNPRLREPVRDQVELRALDLDSLIGPGHPARTIWDYVERLDLRSLEEAVRAREHTRSPVREP